ncbi:MAG TPA: aminotransferase class V-fold PLP-dependent enzyme [Acidimicrobiia bacterium]|nr:aminotransferase class V-fold PLP-dependent enzyme [Acidimicrobiia bacterium]
MLTLAECRTADEADPLADRRAFFDLPPELIYLDGNSLGPPPQSVRHGVEQVLSDWRRRLIAGWWDSGWVDLPRLVGARLEPIVGAEPGSIVCTDSTSVNLFKAVTALCDLSPGDILTDVGNFPSCLYILETIASRQHRRLRVVDPDDVLSTIDGDVGVVSLTQVDFRSGRLHDMEEITRRAAAAGAMTVWDLSHSAGVIPIELARWGADAAVGCGYKYLNGGPGAPAYIYVSPRHSQEAANPINGWFSHRFPFDFSTEFIPADGIDRMRTGTPDILSMVALNEALKAYEAVRVEQVREKSVALTALFIDLVDRGVGCEVLTPREPERRGSHVSLKIPQAEKLMSALADEGVIGDFRPPDVARFGFSPLYIGYEHVWRATAAIKAILARL